MDSAYTIMVNKTVFVRSFPFHYIGVLEAIYPRELVLSKVSWIADSGRWADALQNGELDEVEPYPDGPVIVPRGNICDVSLWLHQLPREQK